MPALLAAPQDSPPSMADANLATLTVLNVLDPPLNALDASVDSPFKLALEDVFPPLNAPMAKLSTNSIPASAFATMDSSSMKASVSSEDASTDTLIMDKEDASEALRPQNQVPPQLPAPTVSSCSVELV